MTQTKEQLPRLREIRRIEEFKTLKPNQIRFLHALLKNNMVVERAGKWSGIDWRNHYWWTKKENYKLAYDKVKEMLADVLESTMLDHAIDGREAPIIYKGKISGYYREIISSERITLLKGLKPQYRDSFNPAGSAAPITLSINYPGAQPAIDVTPGGNNGGNTPLIDDDK